MRLRIAAGAIALCVLGASPSTLAADAAPREIELSDIYGARHYFTEFVDDRTEAIVVVVLDDKCPVVQQAIPTLLELHGRYNAYAKDRAGRPTEFAQLSRAIACGFSAST